VTDEGVKYLSRFRRLEVLTLYLTRVTDECVPILAKLRTLRVLMLAGGVTPDGERHLRNALPDCEVTRGVPGSVPLH